ncbi:MAG TPA: hypothetical protein PLR83_00375 [Pyrinomonadaceae bacterium]|nr:hypothetical protein [Pyrinomonadaceae bacterium]
MNTHIIIGIVVAAVCVIAFAWLFLWRGRDKDDVWDGLVDLGIPKDHAKWKHTYNEAPYTLSTVEVPAQMLPVVRIGIRRTITRWLEKFPEWTNERELSDYRMLFIDPMATNRDGSPAIKVKGIQSAGTTIGLGEAPITERPYLVLPHQGDSGWRYTDYLRDASANEADHYIAGCNNLIVFWWFLGRRDIHPHDLSTYPGDAEALRILAQEAGVNVMRVSADALVRQQRSILRAYAKHLAANPQELGCSVANKLTK